MEDRITAASTRDLCEALVERLQAGAGRWVLELQVEDGSVTKVFRHQQLGATELGGFDALEPASS